MKNPYTGEALKTFERLHVLRSYYNNKLYISPDNVLYYVNKRGYLHAYTAGKCRDYDGSKIYFIRDNLLTRGNMLQESLTTFYQTKEEAKEAWEAMQAEARANTAQETATESQREPETVAAEEEPTEAEKDAQRATERPQETANQPAREQEATAGDTDSTRSDKASQRATEDAPTVSDTQKPATHAPATQEATACDIMRQYAERTTLPRSGTHAPATDQETQRPAKDQEHPQTTASQSTHKPATSPTEARSDRRRARYHNSRKTATQSHRESARPCHIRTRTARRSGAQATATDGRTPALIPRREGTQKATGRTETAQAIHAPPCHRRTPAGTQATATRGREAGRDERRPNTRATRAPAFSRKRTIPRPIFGKIPVYPLFNSFFEKSHEKFLGFENHIIDGGH